MTSLVAAAREVLDWMHHGEWRCCVIGGLAVQRWGEPRLTQDVEGIVVRQFDRLDVARIRNWIAGFAELKEDQDLGRPLEAALASARRRLSRGTEP